MNQDIHAELQKTNRMLNAILGIIVDQHIRATDLAKPRPRSIDRMLADNGLTGSEIAMLLGKTPQAVSQVLAANKKSSKTKPKKPRATSVSEVEKSNEEKA